jgi:hypothetical protein
MPYTPKHKKGDRLPAEVEILAVENLPDASGAEHPAYKLKVGEAEVWVWATLLDGVEGEQPPGDPVPPPLPPN